MKRRFRELEEELGKKTLENEVLTEVVKLAHEKNCLTHALAARERFPLKAVARTLGRARPDLAKRLKPKTKPARRRCNKAADG